MDVEADQTRTRGFEKDGPLFGRQAPIGVHVFVPGCRSDRVLLGYRLERLRKDSKAHQRRHPYARRTRVENMELDATHREPIFSQG